MFKATLRQILARGSIIGINQLFILIAIPVLASRLDLYVFGQIAIGFTLAQLSWIISDWGVQHLSIEEWGKKKNLTEKNKFTSSVIVLNILISTLCLLIIYGLIFIKVIEFSTFFFICLTPSILLGAVYPLWYFQVNRSPSEIIVPTFLSRIIFITLIYFFAKSNETAYWAFLAQGINFFFITLFSFYRISSKYNFRWTKVNFLDIKNLEKKCRPYLINAITNNQVNTLWGFGLAIIGGPLAMAIFNLGDQIYRAGGALTNIIAQSVRINFIGKSFINIRFTLLFFILFYVILSICINLLTSNVIEYFFSDQYKSAIPIIQIMIIAWGLHAIVKLLNYPILGETHGANWVNQITYKILFLHALAFLFWMIFLSGPMSLAVMFTIVIGCQLLIFLFHIFQKIR